MIIADAVVSKRLFRINLEILTPAERMGRDRSLNQEN